MIHLFWPAAHKASPLNRFPASRIFSDPFASAVAEQYKEELPEARGLNLNGISFF
jgi:hypothetical protein